MRGGGEGSVGWKEREWWKRMGWRKKDPRTENKDGNEKQDGIKMLRIIKKKKNSFFFCGVPLYK